MIIALGMIAGSVSIRQEAILFVDRLQVHITHTEIVTEIGYLLLLGAKLPCK